MRTVNFEKLLPADLPPGERILWHGRPDWLSMTRRAFRADLVAIYFAVMTVWNCVTARDGAWPMAAAQTLAAGFAALALLALLGWLSARTTLYVVTSGRIVMKIGVALPVFFNLPYSQIESAAARVFARWNRRHLAGAHEWTADRLSPPLAACPSLAGQTAGADAALRSRCGESRRGTLPRRHRQKRPQANCDHRRRASSAVRLTDRRDGRDGRCLSQEGATR